MVNFEFDKPTVFFDRDGVINHSLIINNKPYAPKRFEDFKVCNDAPHVFEKLKKSGFLNILVTNQPDIGNGLVDIEEVMKMHTFLLKTFLIDKIYMCPHRQVENCDCRKPKPGMLLKAKREFGIDFKRSWMIGDRWSDIEAAKSVNIKSIFIDRGYKESKGEIKYSHIVDNLKSCLEIIL